MPRILFEKKGNAIWISHLDLMRLFQRAFKRADLKLKHTQGFNPRPSVSIALPLSVGVESDCELLDFDLDGQEIPNDRIAALLNEALVVGIKVLDCYSNGRKLRDLSLLRCAVDLEYDAGIPFGAEEGISDLFARDSVVVPKKTKNGIQDQDIIPMIKEFALTRCDGHILEIEALVCCQNPTLNTMQMVLAIEQCLPQWKPDFAKCRRLEIYDATKTVFR